VNLRNPILTHRHLGLDYPIVGTGHADLIDTPSGEWWMVLLAMRPYGGYYYNLGRETFMAPVRWEDEWPVVSPGTGRVEHVYPAPNLPLHPWPAVSCREDFDAPPLALHWNFLRTPPQDFISLSERPGYLRIHLRPSSLKEESNPSFVGRRQQHICFEASAAIEFKPQSENECAGFALVQNNDYHFLFVITDNNGPVLRLIRRVGGKEEQVAEQPVETKRLYLKVEAHEQVYCFHYAAIEDEWHTLAGNVDGRILSTPVAGGFLGTYIALYASSNGMESTNQVDVDWFEYRGLGEV
jgi:alpha-N-arabinofuranosidase